MQRHRRRGHRAFLHDDQVLVHILSTSAGDAKHERAVVVAVCAMPCIRVNDVSPSWSEEDAQKPL